MSEQNGAAATSDTVTRAEYDAAIERARRFEGQLADREVTLGEYKKYGDPKAISAMKADYDALRTKSAKTPEEIDAIVADREKDLSKRFSGKIDELEGRATAAEAKVQRYEVVLPTMQKAAAIFRAEELELVNMLVERDLTSVNGEIVVRGEDGKPKPSAKDPRKNMGPEEYLESIAAKYPGIVKAKGIGTGKPEGGTDGAKGYQGTLPTAAELFAMSPAEIKAKGITHEQIKQIVG